MSKPIKLTLPLSHEKIRELRVGDRILLSGEIFTGRDAAHKRMIELISAGKPLPFDVNNQAIYYAGPCPAPPNKIIGSVGPTTSKRMDLYSPTMISQGLRIMIGKGERSPEVVAAIKEHTGIYLAAIGGAGVIYAMCVEKSELIAFEDLGAEAIYKLTVRDMPLTVAIDSAGGNIYFNREE
jgi:fumarate hydratase subunit beta